MSADIHNGMNEAQAFQKAEEAQFESDLQAARDMGFTNVRDYKKSMAAFENKDLDDEEYMQITKQLLADEQSQAAKFVQAQEQARAEGKYTIDELAFKNDMTEWTPEVSMILRAHKMGMTMEQFNRYMVNVSNQTQAAYKEAMNMTSDEVAQQNRRDFLHFQDELLSAGYERDTYDDHFLRTSEPLVKRKQDGLQYQANYPRMQAWVGKPNQDIKKALQAETLNAQSHVNDSIVDPAAKDMGL